MKQLSVILYSFICLLAPYSVDAQTIWQQADTHSAARVIQSAAPLHYLLYTADEPTLRQKMFSLSQDPSEGQIIELPMPDGSMKDFKVWHAPLMPDKLAARYPGLSTFNAVAVNNPKITAKLDFTSYGFHAMIFDGANVSFIDPADNSGSGYYLVHYKKDETRDAGKRMNCTVNSKVDVAGNPVEASTAKKQAERTSNGYELRTYRLALSCDNDYARAATGLSSPTISQTLSKMITSVNRVNGVYERELSVTMDFVENEDTLIWPAATGSKNGTDPYDSLEADSNAYLSLTINQYLCDTRIGTANYDIGHVFTTGAGGLSQVGVVCQGSMKAQSVTGQPDPVGDGFDIDYVSHEMGHEYGAYHPFNDDQNGSCSPNTIWLPDAYEPGSGSTIMAYAGICASDDLQPHSDAYFNSVNLVEMQTYITSSHGNSCAVITPTNNKLVSIPPFTASYTIPYLTPFELTAPAATDSVTDTSVTYCWEQWNLGIGQTLQDTHQYGPLFRSYYPTTSATRIFPKNQMVLSGVLSNAGTENNQGEKAPDSARYLTFHLTVRDIYQGNGCFLVPDDTVHLDVINTGRGFTVTSQNDSTLIYLGKSPQTVTWDVAGTNAAPVSTPNVDIYLSMDGGNTWPYSLGAFPNTGSASVTMPNPDSVSVTARVKVKGSGNVFFNVSSQPFTLAFNDGTDTSIALYPVPAHDYIIVSSGNKGALQAVVYNSVGQVAWKGAVNGELNIPVTSWARGVYIIKFSDLENHRTIKKFVLD
jgi:hypothetical protein